VVRLRGMSADHLRLYCSSGSHHQGQTVVGTGLSNVRYQFQDGLFLIRSAVVFSRGSVEPMGSVSGIQNTKAMARIFEIHRANIGYSGHAGLLQCCKQKHHLYQSGVFYAGI